MKDKKHLWVWVGLIVVIAILVNAAQLPPLVLALLLGGGGAYVVWFAWSLWQRATGGGERVTYWRGQRIVLTKEKKSGLVSLRALLPALLYLLIGGALLVGAISLVVHTNMPPSL